MTTKLHYFDINGIAESIRYIMHYGNQEFEDVRYDLKKWPIQEIKESLPYGQFPVYEEGDKKLNQSFAIARYVANKAKLVPSDPWEQAVLDATALTIYDYWSKVLPLIRETDPVKKETINKQIRSETIVYYFSRFEKELKSKNGFFAGKLSWVDFVVVGYIEVSQLFLGEDVFQDYPTVLALRQKIISLPGVKDYIATRKSYTF